MKVILNLFAAVLFVSASVLAVFGSDTKSTNTRQKSSMGMTTTTKTTITSPTNATTTTTTKTTTMTEASHIVWAPDMECSTCHTKYVSSMADATLLVNIHVQAGKSKCTDCHELATLAEAHKNVTTGQAIVKARKYPQALCLKCHGKYPDLAKLTVNSTVLKDSKGTVVNPHDLPQSATHVSAKGTECSNCHKMHKASTPLKYCYGCHHAQVFECGTCHPVEQ